MKTYLYAMLISGFVLSCSSSQSSKTKIVGGAAVSKTYNFFASLYVDSATKSFCGGALIDHDIVVTAAHCASGFTSTLRVAIGTTSNTIPEPEQLREVKAIQIHPGWAY